MVNVTVGVEQVGDLYPIGSDIILQLSTLYSGMTSWVYQYTSTLIVIGQIGVFLKGIEGERLDVEHGESTRDCSKVMNNGFNLGYGN